MIAVSYLMERKIKKIFFEVISNLKIFNIKFCSMKLPTTKIFQNLQGLDKGGLDNVEYDMYYFVSENISLLSSIQFILI